MVDEKLIEYSFAERPFACLAKTLIQFVEKLNPLLNQATWYAANVETNNPSKWNDLGAPIAFRIGTASQLQDQLTEADQLMSGVFLAFPEDRGAQLTSHYHTEDRPEHDIGQALVQIHAFDTTYFLVYSHDRKILQVAAEFALALERGAQERSQDFSRCIQYFRDGRIEALSEHGDWTIVQLQSSGIPRSGAPRSISLRERKLQGRLQVQNTQRVLVNDELDLSRFRQMQERKGIILNFDLQSQHVFLDIQWEGEDGLTTLSIEGEEIWWLNTCDQQYVDLTNIDTAQRSNKP